MINDVKKQTGSIIDVQGGFKHGTPYEESKIAWPFLVSTNAKLDTDKDGMPDDWEIKNGLNPKSSNDHQLYTLNKDYTNLEVYINSLTK